MAVSIVPPQAFPGFGLSNVISRIAFFKVPSEIFNPRNIFS